MHTNRLFHEKSPYLQQHAHNPVDWYAWNEEAFEKSRSENKPIFLSIGYSTCHWCHVMERESFESEEIASVLNQYFVPIKVDREERPDVDRIYMTFVQATTGGGGWPMSVWLTPDLKPFYGGTYFPPDSRWGRPGFRQVLEQLGAAWQNDHSAIVRSGDEVLAELKKHIHIPASYGVEPAALDSGFYQFRRSFDTKLGGFGGAPKFPRAVAYNFLFRYFYRTGNEEAADMVLLTLREMAKGGMNDQLGGGFHRYSVDSRWFVPHFEKMLYDQAQLATSYLEGYQISGDPSLAQEAKNIFEYVLRDMTDTAGGFYSAEDADSVIDPANPHEKGEGAFYVWTREEIDRILGADLADRFADAFGVEKNGNVAEDPHGEFTGKNILFRRGALDPADFEIARDKLLAERNKRVRPHLDDKVLTAWNGLMISAFALGSRVLSEPRYLAAAERAAKFIRQELFKDGKLLRRWRAGDAAIYGFLDDHAFFIQALLDLYEADFDDDHLQFADGLTAAMIDLFEDTESGGFYSTAAGDASLVMRVKEDYDGAEPSGNSIAVLNLLRLAHITGKDLYREAGERALKAFGARMASQPSATPQLLTALLYNLAVPKQVVFAGEKEQVFNLLEVMRRRFLPHHVLLWAGTSQNKKLAEMPPIEQGPTAYVCENFACNLPTNDVNQFMALLK